MEKIVLIYKTQKGKEPFVDWLNELGDNILKYRVLARTRRLQHGNYGDHKRFKGIIELRLHFGKGYRVYFGEEGSKIVILLMAGDKSSQDKDIKQALEYWRDYHEQKEI